MAVDAKDVNFVVGLRWTDPPVVDGDVSFPLDGVASPVDAGLLAGAIASAVAAHAEGGSLDEVKSAAHVALMGG